MSDQKEDSVSNVTQLLPRNSVFLLDFGCKQDQIISVVSRMALNKAFKDFDWASASAEQRLARLRAADYAELRAFAREYDWSQHTGQVLGWIMAQKCIDLGTALSVFLNGQPERLNYISKKDVPQELRGAAQVLDTICLRLNSGFYLVWPEQDVADRDRIEQWLDRQAHDRLTGRQGRFVLDETIVETLLNNELRLRPESETTEYGEGTSLLRDIFSPVLELGVSRQILKYHPPKDDLNEDLSNLKY